MSTWLDSKYINLLSSQLRNFKRKSNNLYNFSCPFCGDSKKDKRKARGYVYFKKDGYMYTCHNDGCGSRSIGNLIKHVNPVLFDEYKKEQLLEKYGEPEKDSYDEFVEKMKKPRHIKESPLNDLKKISQLKPGHPAKKYIDDRKIPTTFHHKIFYCPKFMEWTNDIWMKTYSELKFDDKALVHDGPRIVIPFLDKDKKFYGYVGRSMDPNDDVRYISIMIDKSQPKVFGMEDLNLDQIVYGFEGPFDAMFIPNAVAVCGGELNVLVHYFNKSSLVLVFDNEPRSDILCKKVQAAINNDISVCIWPRSIKEKDVNEMVLNGTDPEIIKRIIDNNTWHGLSAQLNFNDWKMC